MGRWVGLTWEKNLSLCLTVQPMKLLAHKSQSAFFFPFLSFNREVISIMWKTVRVNDSCCWDNILHFCCLSEKNHWCVLHAQACCLLCSDGMHICVETLKHKTLECPEHISLSTPLSPFLCVNLCVVYFNKIN